MVTAETGAGCAGVTFSGCSMENLLVLPSRGADVAGFHGANITFALESRFLCCYHEIYAKHIAR
jgi:hypothetical protein